MYAKWSFQEGAGHYTRDLLTGQRDEIQCALRKGRFQTAQDPEWRTGMIGAALLFDGYSTYIRRPSNEMYSPIGSFTVSAWVAPATFDFGSEGRLGAIINQHDREKGEGYILGITRFGQCSFQFGAGGRWIELWSRDLRLPLHQWSYIAATVDAETACARLYLNGAEAVSLPVAELQGRGITPSTADFMIGRNNQGVILAEAFIMNHFHGLAAEIQLRPGTVSGDEVKKEFETYLASNEGKALTIAWDTIGPDRKRFTDDRHRPQFHLNPPGHWMNEPHGPLYFNGRYHLFYQFNPNGPFWHYIHWGHWVSEDLVHWRDVSPALYPEEGIDPDGVWSGSAALDEQGFPLLFFTAGNDAKVPNQSVGLARSMFLHDRDLNLEHWIKHPHPIVEQRIDEGLPGQFRDPFVWKEGNRWIMLVGSGAGEQGGTALVYESTDLFDWVYKGPLYISDSVKYPFLGTVWELPVLLPLPRNGQPTGKHVLLICPWGPGSKADVTYWIGEYDTEVHRFVPDHEAPKLADVGDFHFTGPSGMVDPVTGRTIVFTIAQGERTPEIDYDCGWSHTAGAPVSLTLLEDGQLGISPIEEIDRLRGELLLELHDVELGVANDALLGVAGDMLDIELVFASSETTIHGVSLRRTPDGEEETVLFYDSERRLFGVDRNKASLDPSERTTGIQQGDLDLAGEPLTLRVLLDRSLIEAYANGRKSLTTRAYPSRADATGIKLNGEAAQRIAALRIWHMTAIWE